MRWTSPLTTFLLATVAAALASAASSVSTRSAWQAGDREGERQPGLPDHLDVPDASALSPEDELETFHLAPGYAIELVAAEPLVVDPVVARFDEFGRLWVVEMRGYMPNIDGTQEEAPVGCIAVLTDVDGDGRMDERVDFMDGLVLPRGVHPWRDGALVLAPPDLLFCRDTDGDGRADVRTVVDTGLGGIYSPEHAPNGLLFTLDGWFQLANHDRRYREEAGRWRSQRTSPGGQWGLSRDDYGRVYFNTNSDPLRGGLVPSHWSGRNPNHGSIPGWNITLGADGATWPVRMTPGVNRGYQPATLRDDWTLRSVTAACSPFYWRGTALGPERIGDAFVCEPSGNLVKRYRLEVDDRGSLRAQHGWEGREFLASTDERFRPVDLTEGPDGALYVVDLYRGILQHRIFLTTFLRDQIVERGLDRPVGLGRIWRVTHSSTEHQPSVDFDAASWDDLAQALAHPSGFVRDTAQRVIVQEGREGPERRDAVGAALEFAVGAKDARSLTAALWTLDGLGALARVDAEVRDRALGHSSLDVRRNALQLFGASAPLERLAQVGAVPELRATWLGALGAREPQESEPVFRAALTHDSSRSADRSAVLSALFGRELEFLVALLDDPAWAEPAGGRDEVLRLLARAIAREGLSERVEAALGFAAALPTERAWQARLIEAVIADERGPVVEVEPLDEIDQLAFEDGREFYETVCATCHAASGRGEPGKGPPLRRSAWVLGDEARLILILRDGLSGPIEVGGQRWTGEMPAWPATEEDVASVLTYLRREWGHAADPVDPERVVEVWQAVPKPGMAWTANSLEGRVR